jgi:hypothetical protein
MRHTAAIAASCALTACAIDADPYTTYTFTKIPIETESPTGYQWNTPGVDCLRETRLDFDDNGHATMTKAPVGAEVTFSGMPPSDSEPKNEVTFKFRFEHNGVAPWNKDNDPSAFRNLHIIACELHPPNPTPKATQ